MSTKETQGLLLINTGSPDAPDVPSVRRYLRQFLSDPRVIDTSPLGRWIIVNLFVLPFRPKESAHAYGLVWTDQGSPLIVNSRNFAEALSKALPDIRIEIAMAYGKPSIAEGMKRLLDEGVDRVIVAPMFPQQASATTGSVLESVYRTAAELPNVPPVSVVAPWYRDAGYLDAWAECAGPQLDSFSPDHVLLSFHGLPERHLRKSDPTGRHCLASDTCCENYLEANPRCYRAHCMATTHGLVERLGLGDSDYTLAFQSRLGRDPWLSPATDETVVRLAKKGVKRLAIMSPAFVADCLETLEELGMRARDDFLANGGEDFLMVSSLNDHPRWVTAFAALIHEVTD